MYVCACMCVCTCVCISVCLGAWVCACMCVCMWVRKHVCVYVCVCLWRVSYVMIGLVCVKGCWLLSEDVAWICLRLSLVWANAVEGESTLGLNLHICFVLFVDGWHLSWLCESFHYQKSATWVTVAIVLFCSEESNKNRKQNPPQSSAPAPEMTREV